MAIDALTDNGLVEASSSGDYLSMHRLTQQAFIYSTLGLSKASNLQEAFDGLLFLLIQRFPPVTSTEGLWKYWAECSRYTPHVASLARSFRAFRKPTKAMVSIRPSLDFLKLMISTTWYLFEIGEFLECKELLDIASDACEDKQSIEYAWICNCYVCIAVDENDLETARLYSEQAIAIREAKLEATAIDLLNSYNNFGNALNNECKYDEALKYYTKAYQVLKDVRVGNDNIVYSYLTCLNMLRSHALKGDVDRAVALLEEVDQYFTDKGHKVFLIR
jgi:tetratricopeptide (TPR) repeat protein